MRIGIGRKPRDSYGLKRSTILVSLVRVLGVKGGSSLLYLLAQEGTLVTKGIGGSGV